MMFCVNNNKYVTNTCNIGNIAMLLAFTLCGGIVITANVCSAYQSFIVNNNNTATPGVAMYYHDITNGNRNNTKSVGLMYQDAMYDSSSMWCLRWNQSRIFPLYKPTKLHHQ